MISTVEEHATRAGFRITRQHPIGSNYVRTLDSRAKALEMHKDEAIAIQSEQVCLSYMHYLTGCRELFREGYTDVCQFSVAKS